MNREIKFFTNGLVFVGITFLIAAYTSVPPTMKLDGIAWEAGIFSSKGERIDFISIRERNMTSNGWMMKSGQSACTSCHSSNEHSNIHTIGMVTSNDIPCSALQNEFDAEKFHITLTKGQALDGTQMNINTPPWNFGNDGTADLFAYIKTLP